MFHNSNIIEEIDKADNVFKYENYGISKLDIVNNALKILLQLREEAMYRLERNLRILLQDLDQYKDKEIQNKIEQIHQSNKIIDNEINDIDNNIFEKRIKLSHSVKKVNKLNQYIAEQENKKVAAYNRKKPEIHFLETNFVGKPGTKARQNKIYERNNLIEEINKNSIFKILEDISMQLSTHGIEHRHLNKLIVDLYRLAKEYNDVIDNKNSRRVKKSGSKMVITTDGVLNKEFELHTGAGDDSESGESGESSVSSDSSDSSENSGNIDNNVEVKDQEKPKTTRKSRKKRLKDRIIDKIFDMIQFFMDIKLPFDSEAIVYDQLNNISKLAYLIAGDHESRKGLEDLVFMEYRIDKKLFSSHDGYQIRTRDHAVIHLKMKPMLLTVCLNAEEDIKKMLNMGTLQQFKIHLQKTFGQDIISSSVLQRIDNLDSTISEIEKESPSSKIRNTKSNIYTKKLREEKKKLQHMHMIILMKKHEGSGGFSLNDISSDLRHEIKNIVESKLKLLEATPGMFMEFLIHENYSILPYVAKFCAMKLSERDYGRNIIRDTVFNIHERARIRNQILREIMFNLFQRNMLREDYAALIRNQSS